ncbi:acetyl-CoA carboxylase biotin carboxyl carrier protein [Rhodoligotrophos appendicifer]|uniref:acetyl-CoA carboxylase biotin carboxyl carrier protein n=1 Tax=Rhodoligotrophos appendicifer TaxID=987056 RepID=UPI001960DE1E|nr:acetyl-CoA carboxylase biotin carboxyl carrier protein [Rhodoligotrophos appendicifer]
MGKDKAVIDRDMIRDLADLLNETGLLEIEVEQDGLRVRVSRAGQAVNHFVPAPGSAGPVEPAPAPVPTVADPAKHPGAVKSPMVGTAYRAPAPGAATFVEIGREVTKGQTILIVEAMKTMNQIPAPHSGKVTAIFVEDGNPVEFGEPLMIIE